jgi:hypothetical protein
MAQRAKSRGLADDTISAIERWLKNCQKFTVPILEYYRYSDRKARCKARSFTNKLPK